MSASVAEPSYIPSLKIHSIWDALYEGDPIVSRASLIGSWITVLLCGLALMQAFNYFNDYPTDTPRLKLLVWVLSFINVLHTVFICIAEYSFLVPAGGGTTERQDVGWSLVATIQLHVVQATAVLLYYANISFKMLAGKRIQKPLLSLLLILIILHFAFGTATTAKLGSVNSLEDYESILNTSTIPMVITQVAADVLVAALVCYSLPHSSGPMFRRTREAVQTLIVYTVSRGILTSCTAIVELAGLATGSRGLWLSAADYIIAGLYTNSFLASLNSRNRIRQRMVGIVNVESQLPSPMNITLRRTSTDGYKNGDLNVVARDNEV